MSQTQDTSDPAAATVDVDRVPRPDYKKDAGVYFVLFLVVRHLVWNFASNFS